MSYFIQYIKNNSHSYKNAPYYDASFTKKQTKCIITNSSLLNAPFSKAKLPK